jgi:hypothetical protein
MDGPERQMLELILAIDRQDFHAVRQLADSPVQEVRIAARVWLAKYDGPLNCPL